MTSELDCYRTIYICAYQRTPVSVHLRREDAEADAAARLAANPNDQYDQYHVIAVDVGDMLLDAI